MKLVPSNHKILIISTLITLNYTTLSPSESTEGIAAKIIDGDTIKTLINDQIVTVRLACIDAPEKQTRIGQKSLERLKTLLPVGTPLKINIVDSDRYNRKVAEVYKKRTLINLKLVREGFAVVYPQYLKNCPKTSQKLIDAESIAKEKKRGFWGLPESEQVFPWDWRKLK